MSATANAWADRQRPGSSGRLHLLLVIAHLHRDDVGYATPSTRKLAEKTQQSTSTVERHLLTLERSGYLRREYATRGAEEGEKRRIHLNLNRSDEGASA